MRGAIFDVDGTLLDSMSVWRDLITDFFREHGAELTPEDVEKYKNVTLEQSVPVILDRLGLNISFEELLNIFRRMMMSKYENELPLKEGAGEYMKKLHDGGVKIAVATSGYEELCTKAFTRLGVSQYIDSYAFSSEVGVSKSNPDIYLLAARRLGVEPRQCMVYEDIPEGIKGAKKGGFITCAVYDDTNIKETAQLKELADFYIKEWRELL